MEPAYLVSVLRFDSETDRRVRPQMQRIRQILDSPGKTDGFPHISLVPSKADDCDDVIQRVHSALVGHPSLEVRFSYLGYFGSGVVFLGATPTAALLTLHRQVFEASRPGEDAPWIEYYRPDRWVPHCTLAMEISKIMLGGILDQISGMVVSPIHARCVAIEWLKVQQGRIQRLKRMDLS